MTPPSLGVASRVALVSGFALVLDVLGLLGYGATTCVLHRALSRYRAVNVPRVHNPLR